MNNAAASGTEQSEWRPRVNPWIIAVTVMLSAFMVQLDSSIANVALPYIAGDLSATTDESTWVLTSYLVSTAIMLPITGWLSRRLGRKCLLMTSIVVFTVASMLCGMSISMPMLILSRVLQGVGGAVVPMAQSILLESFPRRQHGTAMAVFGVGVVIAPVLGPTLGGWITDNYSWRWIFYIKLPLSLVAWIMTKMFIDDPPYLKQAVRGSIDFLGLGLMTIWLGTQQAVLDKGQEADWFGTPWICWTAAISATALISFIIRELTNRQPIVQLHVLGNRNFLIGTVITGIFGVVLYGVTTMLPLFLQTLMGYTALNSGMAVSPRGFGAVVSMVLAGAFVRYVDGRLLLAGGFGILMTSAIMLSHLTLQISMSSVVVVNIVNGFASGFIFVPLTTLTMSRLRKEEIGNAAGIYNLVRNIGGSVGIATITTLLVRGSQTHQNYLVRNVTAGATALLTRLHGLESKFFVGGTSSYTAHRKALRMLYAIVQKQASLLTYCDTFRLLGFLSLLCIPLALLFQQVRKQSQLQSQTHTDAGTQTTQCQVDRSAGVPGETS